MLSDELLGDAVPELRRQAERRGGDALVVAVEALAERLAALRQAQRAKAEDSIEFLREIFTVARNLMLNERRRIPPVPLDTVDAASLIDAPADSLHSDDNAALVQWALERLPARQRSLLEAFHFERRSTAQIASSFELSERAVEGRLRRARQNLRRELEAALDAAGGTP